MRVDNFTGLAQIALDTGRDEDANTYARDILRWLSENGPDGIEFPLQAQLTCYKVLARTAHHDPTLINQAKDILEQAYNTLMTQANNIQALDIREGFLQNDKTNRDLVTTWENLSNL